MLVVISDTSVISNFLHLGQLHILQKLYRQVYIPQAVYEEINQLSQDLDYIPPFQHADWVSVKSPSDSDQVVRLLDVLDRGEAEAIVLALEMEADFLLVDELLGRQEARKQGISIVGTLGILLKAKEEKIIEEIMPLMDILIEKGFWIGKELYEQVLDLANE
ncbi:MAG: DUF3368 domain-containing protein [Bacteroidota bacterium]